MSRFFEDTQVLCADGNGELRLDSFPDGRARVVMLHSNHAWCAGGWVFGPRTRANFKALHGIERAVVATIKPGWASALLDVPATELTDKLVRLDALWGAEGRALSDKAREPDFFERFAAFAMSRKRAHAESSTARLARHAVRLLEADSLQVNHVAARLGVTSRHLRRAFAHNVGVGPKDFARGVRLRRALRLVNTSDDLGGVATNAGYFDQSHFSSDFKALIGLTPSAFMRRPLEKPTAGSC